MVGTLVKDASGDTGGMPPEMGAMMNNLNSMMGQMTNKMKEDK